MPPVLSRSPYSRCRRSWMTRIGRRATVCIVAIVASSPGPKRHRPILPASRPTGLGTTCFPQLEHSRRRIRCSVTSSGATGGRSMTCTRRMT